MNSGATVSGAGTTNFSGAATVNVNGGSNITTPVTILGGTVNVAPNLTLPTLTQSGGTLAGGGNVTVTGATTWSGGIVSGAGAFNPDGGLTISGGVTLRDGPTLNNSGTTVLAATLNTGGTPGATINNNGTFDIQADFSFLGGFGGTNIFNNIGTLTKSAGPGVAKAAGAFNNTGIVNANSGVVNLAGGGTSSGAFNVVARLQFSGGTHDLTSGAMVSGTGTTGFSGGQANFAAGSNITTAADIAGGVANIAPNVTLPSLTQSTGTLMGSGAVTVSGATAWSGGTIRGPGAFNPDGGLIISGSVSLQDGRTLNNNGTALLMATLNTGGTPGATINNNGTFDLQGDVTFLGGLGGTNVFNNVGTLTKSAGAGLASANGDVNNSGTVNANFGTLSFGGSFTQSGGLTRLNGGSISTTTTLLFNGGALDAVGGSTITGSVNNAGATVRPGMSPGLLTITGAYTQGALGVLDIELGGAGGVPGTDFDVLAITGSATLGGTLNVNPFMGFVPSGNFQIMTFGSRIGDFATINNNTAGAGFTATPGATNYVVSFTAGVCNINAVASGDWASGATWSGGGVPGAGDNPCIDADQFAVTVSAGAQAANSLTVTGTANPFAITGGSLDLASASSIAGPFMQTGDTLLDSGSLTIGGLFTWSGGTQSGAGVTNANGGMNLSGANLTLARTLNNSGAATSTPVLSHTLTVTGAFNNLMGATFLVSDAAGGALLDIQGTGAFNNSGTVDVATLIALGMSTSGGGTHTGTFNVSGSLEFSAGGTHNLQPGSSVTGGGTVFFSQAGTVVNVAGTYNFGGTTLVNAGTVNFNSAASTNQLNMRPFNGTLAGTGTLTVSGLFTWEGGTQLGAGTTVVNGGMAITGPNAKTLDGRTLNNMAAATFNATALLMDNGAVFNNQPGATFDMQVDGFLGSQIALGAQTFNNAGTFTKSGGASVSNSVATFNNTGTVNVNTGTLNLAVGGTSSGVFNIAVSAALSSNGGIHNMNSGATVQGLA